MRLPPVRFTVRRLMIAVAIFGPAAGLAIRYAQHRRDNARALAHMATGGRFRSLREAWKLHKDVMVNDRQLMDEGLANSRKSIEPLEGRPPDEPIPTEFQLEVIGRFGAASAQASSRASWARRKAAHFEAMRAKYEHAAAYPRLPVEPDPPEPK